MIEADKTEGFAFPKQTRIKDPELLSVVRNLPCLCCLKSPADAHHVTSRGAGGGDTETNVMPLCREHHQEWHARGSAHMVNTYGAVKAWLELAERWDVLGR